ncbi:MAG: S-layer homology domain-containing protein, partial [Syntrophomonas sp.]|nr:S-layer homology domain-containing protein [Syntrophomonas sp.]
MDAGPFPSEHWASESVAAAAANQLISGYPDNTFRGGNFATRAEAVMVITQAL